MDQARARGEIQERRLEAATLGGALISALGASACCLGPLVLAALGIGGAGLLVKLEPWRPWLTGVTLALLGAGFHLSYRRVPRPAAEEGGACACEHPRASRAGRRMLWVATGGVVAFLAFPYLAPILFG